jgi:hypothetical protein
MTITTISERHGEHFAAVEKTLNELADLLQQAFGLGIEIQLSWENCTVFYGDMPDGPAWRTLNHDGDLVSGG